MNPLLPQLGELEFQRPAVYEPLPTHKKLLMGIPRSVLEELAECNLIRISEFRPPGRRTVLRLVHMPSLLAFIRSHGGTVDLLVAEAEGERGFYGSTMPPEVSRQLRGSEGREEAAAK
jgi:hypothetical protein